MTYKQYFRVLQSAFMQIILLDLHSNPVKAMYSVANEKTWAENLNCLPTESEPARGRVEILTEAL